MKKRPFVSSFLASSLVIAGLSAHGADQVLTLKESLGLSWTNELVSFPFEAKKGDCVAASIQVTGPRGPVAAQLTAIEYWPGKEATFVKSARLCFIVDGLKPLESGAYTIAYGKKASPAMPTDLKIQSAGETAAEITTAGVGARLPLGGKIYEKPAAAKDVPGPLAAMRLKDGAWAGGSSLTGDVNVVAWKAELTDAGPVLARVAVSYTLADSNVATFAATVVAGDTAVRWDMSVRNDRPALGVEFRLPPVQSAAEWEARRKILREMVLLRAGLWPEPEKTPLNARVFDGKKGDGFIVEKVYFESLPGFYATGHLYRPSKGTPPSRAR